jgi:hypothetical protein
VSRRPPPKPAANTAARGVLVVAVAALLGFLILKNVDTGGAVDAGDGGASAATTTTLAAVTTTAAPTTTAPALNSFTLIVANASGVSGAAKRKGDQLKAEGFQVAEPVTNQTKSDTTTIFYVNGYDAAARLAAEKLNVSDIQPMATPPPVDIGQAQVLVNLGRDIASDQANEVTTTT